MAGQVTEASAKAKEAEDLWNVELLEALMAYKDDIVKRTKVVVAIYTYCYESWREGGNFRNVYWDPRRR